MPIMLHALSLGNALAIASLNQNAFASLSLYLKASPFRAGRREVSPIRSSS